MKLERAPEFHALLSTYFLNAEAEADEETIRAFIAASPSERQEQVLAQARLLIEDAELPVEEFGTEANRWFADAEEARVWLRKIVSALEKTQDSEGSIVVKDSNGALLAEGDSVQVIKDLKVKGGASDLKRGTLVKKIHLTGDPESVECRVEGSALVLKTCFLKKV